MTKEMKMHLVCIYVTLLSTMIHARENCPVHCDCTSVAIHCAFNKEITNTDALEFITKEFYPDLRNLNITGANFGSLAADTLLPPSAPTDSIVQLTLSNNGITEFDHETIYRMYNLEVLNLSHNAIGEFGLQLLAEKPRLRTLDLTDAIDKSLDTQTKADLIRTLFVNRNTELAELNFIYLDDNDISYLHPDTFCSLSGIKEITLRNNKLTEFFVQTDNCAGPGPEGLFLSGNLIETIGDNEIDVWKKHLLHLRHLDISNNSLRCDCKLKSFLKWYKMNQNYDLSPKRTICTTANPSYLVGRDLMDVNIDELACDEATRGSFFGSLFWLLLIVVACSIVCLVYRRRRRQYLQSVAYRGVGESERYAFVGGYHKLNGGEHGADREPPAEFV